MHVVNGIINACMSWEKEGTFSGVGRIPSAHWSPLTLERLERALSHVRGQEKEYIIRCICVSCRLLIQNCESALLVCINANRPGVISLFSSRMPDWNHRMRVRARNQSYYKHGYLFIILLSKVIISFSIIFELHARSSSPRSAVIARPRPYNHLPRGGPISMPCKWYLDSSSTTIMRNFLSAGKRITCNSRMGLMVMR